MLSKPTNDRAATRGLSLTLTGLLAGTALAGLLAAAAPIAAQVAPQEVNRIVLRVNDQILTLHDYEKRKARQINRILSDPSLDPEARQEQLAVLGKALMRNIFEELLVRSRASQLSIVVDDVQVERAIDRIRREQNIQTEQQMAQALAGAGLTMDELREIMRRDLLTQQVMGREVQERIQLDEDDLRAYYRDHPEEFRIPERRWLKEVIVLDSSGLDEGQRRSVAAEIKNAVDGGVPFEEAVAPYQEQGITTGVVDLGWLQAEELSGALRDAAFSLEPGAYSEPIEARGGLHVLHLVELQESQFQPFSEVQEEIYRREQAKRIRKEMSAYMAELAARAYVRENLPPEAVGYRQFGVIEEQEPSELDILRAPLRPKDEEDDEGGS